MSHLRKSRDKIAGVKSVLGACDIEQCMLNVW